MIVAVVLNNEYMDISSRTKWYLKLLLHCKENGWILITHDYMRKNIETLQKEITPSLFESWEMTPFTADEVCEVEQYFVDDSLFDIMEMEAGSRTEMLFRLSNTKDNAFSKEFSRILEDIQKNHVNEKIDAVLHCLESWNCVQDVCKKMNITLIPFSFSAFRKTHGYMQTLYHTNMRECMHTTVECKNRYEAFLKEKAIDIPILSNEELIALLGKKRTLPLLPLMNTVPKYEIGLCTECFSVIPQFFIHDKTTDDDVRFACDKYYSKDQMAVRNHALQVDYMQLDRTVVHNDPAPWILSCRRIAIARSQILLKAMLWKRTSIVLPDTLGFSFMGEKDYQSTNLADIKALNFYIFAYLIPNNLMYSNDYWKWRLSWPSESEIYKKHLEFLSQQLGVDWNKFSQFVGPERLRYLLECRSCDTELIDILCQNESIDDIDYNTATSRFDIDGSSHWRINKVEGKLRHCHIVIEKQCESIEFYPLDDVAGCARLHSVRINGTEIDVPGTLEFRYMPKTKGHFIIPARCTDEILSIDILWEYKSNQQFLEDHI